MAEHPHPDLAILTDEEARKIFIDDGGQAEYYDPINGAREQRRIAGRQFDLWLQHHDEELSAKLYNQEQRRARALGFAVEWATSWNQQPLPPIQSLKPPRSSSHISRKETNHAQVQGRC